MGRALPAAAELPEPATLAAVVRRNARHRGAVDAIVTDDRSVTHAELDDRSRALAARLAAAGVGKGSRLGLLAPNGVEWALTAVAAWRIGAVVVPLSTLLRPPELAGQLRLAAVTHLVLTDGFRGRAYTDDLEVIAPGIGELTASGRRHPDLPDLQRVWSLGGVPTRAAAPDLVEALEREVRPADDLCVLFTSGSRGTPKGTVHTHDSALHAVAGSLPVRGLGAEDRLYIPMPFFWTGGLSMGLLSTLVAGATLLTEAVPDAERTLALLERERVTLFRGWPDQAAALAAHPRFAATDLSQLKPGSLPAVLPPSTRPAPGSRSNLFGMTETFGTYAGDPLDTDMPAGKWGSCGRLLPGVEVRIADVGTGGPVAAGCTGEVCVRGRNVMRAICGRTRGDTFDADGWYHTGDLGRLDVDGYLWFDGRTDDMVKVRGATVYPSEVEEALRRLAGVQQAHVTDVLLGAGPGASGGVEVGALVVTTRPVEELQAEVRERLSSFKVPTLWATTDDAGDVPRTATAKVDKAALQDLLRRTARRAGRARTHTGGQGAWHG
jgi:acyl-CoA synthetase (AMP-forming)/AMP-acid ligase II